MSDSKDKTPPDAQLNLDWVRCGLSTASVRYNPDETIHACIAEIERLRVENQKRKAGDDAVRNAYARGSVSYPADCNWLVELPMTDAEYTAFRRVFGSSEGNRHERI